MSFAMRCVGLLSVVSAASGVVRAECVVTISEVIGYREDPVSARPQIIQVKGTASECVSGEVEVFIGCGEIAEAPTPWQVVAFPEGSLPTLYGSSPAPERGDIYEEGEIEKWCVDFLHFPPVFPCPCGGPLWVVAFCVGDPDCSAPLWDKPLDCESRENFRPCGVEPPVVEPQCPTGVAVTCTSEEGACADPEAERSAVVICRATVTPVGAIEGEYQWLAPDSTNPFPTTTGNEISTEYEEPGDYPVTAVLRPPAGSDCEPLTGGDTLEVPPCVIECPDTCPTVTLINEGVSGCASTSGGATLSVSASLAPARTDCEFGWSFDDGTPTTWTPDRTASNAYTATGDFDVVVSVRCPECDACVIQAGEQVTISSCTPGPGRGTTTTPDETPWGCGALAYILVFFFVAAAVVTTFFVAALICPGLLAAGVRVTAAAVWILIGIWAIVAILIALRYFLCAFDICPCPTKCDWLILGWAGALSMAIVWLYLGTCCAPFGDGIAAGAGIAALAAFAAWLSACDPSVCGEVAPLLLLVLASIVASILAYVSALLPEAEVCGRKWVVVLISTLVAANVLWSLLC